jgi:hypothetical protein
MRNSSKYLRNGAVKRCAICDGKFGLIRYHSWRTALCSKQCADRFIARQGATAGGYADFEPPDNSCSENQVAISRRSGFRNKEAAQCTFSANF